MLPFSATAAWSSLEAADMLQKLGCCVYLILMGISSCRCICCGLKLALRY